MPAPTSGSGGSRAITPSDGVWVKIAKKATAIESVRYPEVARFVAMLEAGETIH